MLQSTDPERLSNREGLREKHGSLLGRGNTTDFAGGLEGQVRMGIGELRCEGKGREYWEGTGKGRHLWGGNLVQLKPSAIYKGGPDKDSY